ncbi:Alpha/Beta hydrolase protein [Flammula alnicola]|nr:Alpha/Beta hydrolase protein [Flammula alnicola]
MSLFFKLVWYNQRLLVYPSGFEDRPRNVLTPNLWKLPYDDVELTTKDKVTLRCYLIRKPGTKEQQEALGTIIMFHGNAMNHGDTLWAVRKLFKKNFNIFTLEYRGYGHNEGSPSEKGLCIDAQTALDYVLTEPSLSTKPIIYGQSLGGAVAIDVTSRNADKISALIVENTFTSIPDLVKGWPVICHFSFLCTQKWKSGSKVACLPTALPILMLSGLSDEVIPPQHMQNLWEIACRRNQPKQVKSKGDSPTEYIPPAKDAFKTFSFGSHNTTSEQSGYWETVYEFLDQLLTS